MLVYILHGDGIMKINLNFKNRNYIKISIFFLSGIIMIGHGARMIYQGVFIKGSTYTPNTFDLFFDWIFLLICFLSVLICFSKVFQVVFSKFFKV